jgi:hypothetical protein
MESWLIPYPKTAGKSERFDGKEPEKRAFEMVHRIAYPHLVLIAKKIGSATRAETEEDINRQISVLSHLKPLTVEDVATILIDEDQKESV